MAAASVTITNQMVEDVDQYPRAIYPPGSTENPIVGLLQAVLGTGIGGFTTGRGGDLAIGTAGTHDVEFTNNMASADYFIMCEFVRGDGVTSRARILWATRAVDKFQVTTAEAGTLYWHVWGNTE